MEYEDGSPSKKPKAKFTHTKIHPKIAPYMLCTVLFVVLGYYLLYILKNYSYM